MTHGREEAAAANIQLEPVESVTVTTLVDNVTDISLQNQGPAKRPPPRDPATFKTAWARASRCNRGPLAAFREPATRKSPEDCSAV